MLSVTEIWDRLDIARNTNFELQIKKYTLKESEYILLMTITDNNNKFVCYMRDYLNC